MDTFCETIAKLATARCKTISPFNFINIDVRP